MTSTSHVSRRDAVGRRLIAVVAALTLLLSGFVGTINAAPAAAQEILIPYGNVIVVLQDGLDPSAFASASGVQPAFVYGTLITGFAANLTEQAAQRLARVPQVKGIYPDNPVTATAQVIPTGVERANAPRNPIAPFTNGSGGSIGGTVAVVDSGVASLADLNVIGGYNCSSDGGIDNWGDFYGHGTHVSGTLGAINNTSGVVGVAPGVAIFSARALNASGSGSQSNLVCALEAVAQNPSIRVANLSLETPDANAGTCGVDASALHQAVCNLVNQGTSVVVAAGNHHIEVPAGSLAGYPEVISVSAFQDFDGRPGGLASSLCSSGDIDDTYWATSNWGSLVDIMAPGVCIRSYDESGGQVYRSGTSMASPHVAGALALYYAANPGSSVSAARSWLLGSATRSQAAAGVTGGLSGEPVLSLGSDLPTPTPTRTPTTNTTGTATQTPPAGLGPGVVGRVTTRLNLRSAPSSGANVITVLPTDTLVTVTGYSVKSGSYDYIPVSTPLGDGWVASQYVTAVGTATPTRTPTLTNTPTSTRTPTQTLTSTSTFTPSSTPTASLTPTLTPTRTPTSTASVTFTPSSTPTRTATRTPSNTPTNSPTRSATDTPTPPSGLGPGVVGRTTTGVNLRNAPTTSASIIATLPTNTEVSVTGYSVRANGYDFIPVSTAYGNGWVASNYVSATGTVTPTRTPTATRTPSSTRTPTTPGGPTNTPTRTPTRTATSTGGIAIGSTVRSTTRVNMRSGAGTNNDVVSVLPVNATGTVMAGPTTATGYQWYRVNMGTYGIGWVAVDYLSVISGPSSTPTRTATTVSGFPSGSTVQTTDSLNMRNGAGTGNTVIALLPTGTSCTVVSGPTSATGYLWYRINCPGFGIGYVAGDYLEQVSASSVSEDPLTPVATQTAMPATATEAIGSPESTLSPLDASETITPAPTEFLPEASETPEPSPTDEPLVPTDIPASPAIEEPRDVPATEIAPAEIAPTEETGPQSLPVARVQRTEGSSPAQVLVDNDPATVWTTDGSAVLPLAAFVADLDSVQYVSSISWQSGSDGIAGTLYVSVSTDNETWTDLSIESIAAPGEWQELTVDAGVRYIRFVFVNDEGLGAVGGIAELKVWP